jgi:hypothetical protein
VNEVKASSLSLTSFSYIPDHVAIQCGPGHDMVDRFLFLHDEPGDSRHAGPPSSHVTIIVYKYIPYGAPVDYNLPVPFPFIFVWPAEKMQ